MKSVSMFLTVMSNLLFTFDFETMPLPITWQLLYDLQEAETKDLNMSD